MIAGTEFPFQQLCVHNITENEDRDENERNELRHRFILILCYSEHELDWCDDGDKTNHKFPCSSSDVFYNIGMVS